jgi:hypothetical protein
VPLWAMMRDVRPADRSRPFSIPVRRPGTNVKSSVGSVGLGVGLGDGLTAGRSESGLGVGLNEGG